MLDAKPVKTPLAAHFRLSADLSPQTDEEVHVSCSLCQCSWKHYVCYVVHSTGHFTCSQCRKSIYEHATKRPLAGSEMDFRYLKGFTNIGLCFDKKTNSDCKITGYSDLDFAGDLNRRRFLTGYTFTFSGSAIS